MTSTFNHFDAARAKKRILAVLPDGLKVEAFVINSGRTLSIHINNQKGHSQSKQFGWIPGDEQSSGRNGLDFNDRAINTISQVWCSGTPVAIQDEPTPPPSPPKINSEASLQHWLSTAKTNDQAAYFTGSLAQFREDAQPRIVELQRLADRADAKSPRPAVEHYEVLETQKKLDMLELINILVEQNVITLVQRRDQISQEIIYLIVKKGKRHMVISHPFTAMKTQKTVSAAIQKEWMAYRKDFSIANIAYEGGDDATHNATALVEVYKGNPQVTMITRVPIMDLGSDQTKWPAILRKKAEDVKRQIRIRFGRKNTTLEDIA